jgi:hypothetical protein
LNNYAESGNGTFIVPIAKKCKDQFEMFKQQINQQKVMQKIQFILKNSPKIHTRKMDLKYLNYNNQTLFIYSKQINFSLS